MIRVLVLYVLPVAEYTGICCGYLTACCHQASSGWRSSEVASYYRIVILGTNDFKHFENMACIGTWSFCYMCHYEFGQMYWLVIVKCLMWYLAM
ncbi:tRNA guanosine-2'-O-methyltransferase TRM13 [Gossypium arboreum]|uniref:tRNA guanosine-2'-O-methyltransferase TRM13 n=1 Tax=Gossypium arboreum TaxID=29729 RepID=A0A0B0MK44_GOSAR|nr:tRNA guanosine-2'-O-methyltransferase TRM13 [Gossypium arboreum]